MRSRLILALCFSLVAAFTLPASAEDYVGYRRIGAWNLAKKTSPTGKRIEMMAVAANETEADFFLVMCALTGAALYVSIVTKEPALTKEDPLRLKVRYAFDATTAEFDMQKVLVDDQAVLRDDAKEDVAAMLAAFAASQAMTVDTEGFKRSYALKGFTQAFEIVDTACRRSAAP